MNFWQTIAETNTFNFAILLLISAVLYKKLNVSNIVENIRLNIIKGIDDALSAKKNADEKLKDAEISVSNLNIQIKEMTENAEKQAKGLSESISSNAEKQANSINDNTVRTILSEEKTIGQRITKNTLESSVKLAESHIRKVLKENPELHGKFIEESLEEI